ncbi:NAD(P)H-dependent oxidoreductase [Roseibacterium sp. SDUM158016]|uniref:NAD(P)H-dependent oxidoreductase n=1 Tax=Roseicyclus sediminis TaxID=2980997 RepID=UPI0021D2A351|nr:NAD(P)H-dependent oxidoreductase [Roseibacterium sp. SDUM158016]MCU4655092.1 NAD(P)H-dependent oxidoreductase [Roseibacterium sp. SDUM158016]
MKMQDDSGGGTCLIVLAHPEARSFCGAWAEASAAGAEAAGARVLWSDLCAMGFDPVEGQGHYPGLEGRFDPLKAQGAAAEKGRMPADVAAEVEKIEAADVIVFHFPLWWFGPPAILKGWLDRCLVHGRIHDVDHRFDAGRMRGKRALFCVSTGAKASESGPGGKEGETRLLLWPLAYTLRYCGFDVAEPLLVHGVHGYFTGAEEAALEERLSGVLAAQAGMIAGLSGRALMSFNADADFDDEGRLKPGAPSHSPFIRRAD